ncbi:MAG: helix-turn-helix transcriptional regulator [Bacteroidota bacterium]
MGIISIIDQVANLKRLPREKFRDITAAKQAVKEFEIKKNDLRVYAIKEDGHIIVLGGRKSDQDEDIKRFRSIKQRYLDSKKIKFMLKREEILSSPEYWFEDAQNELYRQVVEYMERENLNQTQLSQRLGVTKGYVSQILKGEFNYTLKKLIELSLAIGKVARIEYQSIAGVLADDNKSKFVFFSEESSKKTPLMMPSESQGISVTFSASNVGSKPFYKNEPQVA